MASVNGDGAAEDMVRSFVQLSCAELHAKTILEKTEAELEEGIVDVENEEECEKAVEKIASMTEELNLIAECRRAVMLKLFNMYEGDKDYWCMVKHLGSGAFTLFEAYQATEDPDIYNLALEANKCFVQALTHFLGVEITDCASCFADLLKAKEKTNA